MKVWSLYVPNGRGLDDPHFTYKLHWLEALRAYTQRTLAAQPDLPLALLEQRLARDGVVHAHQLPEQRHRRRELRVELDLHALLELAHHGDGTRARLARGLQHRQFSALVRYHLPYVISDTHPQVYRHARGLLDDGRVNGAEERLDGRELLGVRRGGGIAAEEADVKVGLGELEQLAAVPARRRAAHR